MPLSIHSAIMHAPTAPSLEDITPRPQGKNFMIILVLLVYIGLTGLAYYLGTIWLENTMQQLILAIQELKDEVHNQQKKT